MVETEGYFYFTYCVNTVVSGICLLLFIICFKLKVSNIYLPQSLKLYFTTACIPHCFLTTLLSLIWSISFLIDKTEKSVKFLVLITIIGFTAQKVRVSIFILILERVIATIFLEKYSTYLNRARFLLLTIISYIFAIAYLVPLSGVSLYIFDRQLTWYLLYATVTIHLTTLIICRILHCKNKQMYKLLVYRVSLDKRRQILENYKMLASVWIDLLIFTCIGPLGPIFYTFHPLITGEYMPFCIMHLSYNISFIIILLRKIYLHYSINNILPTTTNNEFIVSPFGKNLPANVTFDSYFNELNKQWN